MKKTLSIISLSVLITALASFYIFSSTYEKKRSEVSTLENKEQQGAFFRTVNLENKDYPDFTFAAESSVDAVVFVKVTVKESVQYSLDPLLEYFFGTVPKSKERETKGSGSGVIIRQDGYIVTNNHVVAGASEIEVTLNNNKKYLAKLIGADAATDIALIKMDEENLPVIPMGDSDQLRLGEWVLAIGSPYNLRSTITAGIVSAKGRSSMSTGKDFKIESFIQTDAAVNPGNSGGALVNKAGKLVGINTMIYSQTGAYSGYSFAVPVNIVKKIVNDLIDFGVVKRVKLGVLISDVNDDIAKKMKLSSPKGVYINKVLKGSVADLGGIKEGDIVLKIDSTYTNVSSSFLEKINGYHPGDKACFTVIREGKKKELVVTFAADDFSALGEKDLQGTLYFYGSRIKTATKTLLKHFNLKYGVEVVSVGEGKLQEAGIEERSIILFANDKPVYSAEELVSIVKNSRRSVFLEGVTSGGKAFYIGFGKE